ncbi:alpha-galactosidase [Halorussus sp. MSC15.2]|uniref:alpha-galactosidase n=1 Tax=Halorussus sp. MSC15.2 TaxID=2283638 RepID=UPI001967C9AB|nr:alpha-galactosidase [Halorussus sp. MSC15.2]
MEISASDGDTAVSYRPEERRLAVERDGETLLDGRVRLDVGDEELPATESATIGESGEVVRAVHDGVWGTTVELEAGDGTIDVRVAVRNPRDRPVALGDLRPLTDARAPSLGAETRRYRHGYQSWTPTATLPVGERFPAEENPPQMLDPAAPPDASHGVTALLADDSALTMGFLDHSRFVSRFEIDHDADGVHGVSAVCPGDGTRLDGGERLVLPTLRIDATHDLPDALAALADATADRMDARVPADAPTGWCSWYHYFTDVTAADVRENLGSLGEWGAPLDLVQVDDGYQTAFGDWRTLAEGFEDVERLVDEVREAGRTPGLWLAPFYVQSDSALAADHPEWLVTDDGDPVDAGPRHGPMYALDTTHPDARRWLRETFETIADDWGFDYLKLDFLYAAALPGERHADVTRAAAYRSGLSLVREAVGDDTFLLGCGAPQGQSVGLVDAMRVGPDTAPHWRADPASQPAHENAIRNVLNRQWTHRRLWLNDPDCQLVRETTDLSLAERRSFAAVVALLGGSNVISDRVADIGEAGRRLVERTLPPVETGQVRGVGERELPTRVVAERPADGGLAVAAFNWRDEPLTLRVDPAEYGLGAVRVWDAFERADRGTGPVEREVPAHGCLLAHLAPTRDRPHLVGSDHLANLASRVTAVDWDADGTLSVTLDASRPQTAVVATPDDWTHAGDAGDAGIDGERSETTEIELAPGENDLSFERR